MSGSGQQQERHANARSHKMSSTGTTGENAISMDVRIGPMNDKGNRSPMIWMDGRRTDGEMEAGVIGLDLAGLVERLEEADDVAERHLAVGRVRQEMLPATHQRQRVRRSDAAARSMSSGLQHVVRVVEGRQQSREKEDSVAADCADGRWKAGERKTRRCLPSGVPNSTKHSCFLQMSDIWNDKGKRRAGACALFGLELSAAAKSSMRESSGRRKA
eukprot:890719-Rhodomonas_salina.3